LDIVIPLVIFVFKIDLQITAVFSLRRNISVSL